jgi:NAD(P)-dependent dehydrogenase (short-subunit alcohol dehydrogenase family)
MIANAGIASACPFLQSTLSLSSFAVWLTSRIVMTVEEMDRVYAVNTRGTFLCYKYAGIQMVSQGRGGRIVGACSISGKKGGRFVVGMLHFDDGV